jgi:hypothetical protein
MYNKQDKHVPRGFNFGYWLMEEIAVVGRGHCKKQKTNNPSIPGLRFPKYREPYIPEWENYKDEVGSMVYHCLKMWEYATAPLNRKKRREIYNQFVEKLKGSIHYCGPLVANHLIVPLGIMGLVPIWLCSECALDPASKGFQFLRDQFGLPSGKNGAEQLIDAVVTRITTDTNKGFSSRNAENLVCKAFRVSNNNDGKFSDIITKCQHVYEIIKDGVVVHFQNSECEIFKTGLILDWNWQADMVKTKHLATKMTKVLENDVADFIVPKQLQRLKRGFSKYKHQHAGLFFKK